MEFLIVDTDSCQSSLLTTFLRPVAPARVATDPRAACSQLATMVHPAGVVLDACLGTETYVGLETLELLRRHHPHLPALLLCTEFNSTLADQALLLNAVVLRKPAAAAPVRHFARRAVARRARVADPRVEDTLADIAQQYALTGREIELIVHAIQRTPRAAQLDTFRITESTLRTQVRTLLAKVREVSMDRVAIGVLRAALGDDPFFNNGSGG